MRRSSTPGAARCSPTTANELDTSLMDGATSKTGSGGLHQVKNPILLARAIMETQPRDDGRRRRQMFAKAQGIRWSRHFRTEKRWKALQDA